MSTLARFASKYTVVSGSDCKYQVVLQNLKNCGIDTYVGHNLQKICDSDLVVFTAAISDDDAELKAARDLGITAMERKEFLKIIADCANHTIAVAGSHGKTTVSAMLAHIFNVAKMSFFAHIGGDCIDIGGGFIDNGDEWFITEACEYNRSFLELNPTISVITNISFDHPDCYDSLDDITAAFAAFAAQSECCIVRDDVLNADDIITFGYNNATFIAKDITEKMGRYSFKILKNDKYFGDVSLLVVGEHNILNALAAAAAADRAGIEPDAICLALKGFNGVKRRFECKGKTQKGARVISDYAHHPDEIVKTIDAARRQGGGKIVGIFEPHTYSRTAKLFEGFLQCFYWLDELILLPTYAARERAEMGIESEALYNALKQNGDVPYLAKDYASAVEYANFTASSGDIILVMGAGSVDRVADLLVEL